MAPLWRRLRFDPTWAVALANSIAKPARPVRFQNAGGHWVALVPGDPGSIVRVDSQVVAPGQEAILKGDHVLQIGEVRVRVHVTLPEGTSREGEPINVQVQSVFSQTAEWIDKTLKE